MEMQNIQKRQNNLEKKKEQMLIVSLPFLV